MTQLGDFTLNRLDGTAQEFSDYAGKLVLVVNTASQCGLTPQYGGLETLWQTYGDKGLVVLGFPCNQFGGQEPGTAGEIAQFCETQYSVTFPLFEKLEVNGAGESPLYTWLKAAFPGDVEWNFAKFLIGRDGTVVARFPADLPPENMVAAIEQQL
ncbi:glutathione peroxidase [Devosia sp. YR412]|uniref:glutathione peroxidase n=1 Tax=Devosia sp. YR412 TaxID=1881030 RepID=UPI0008D0CB08|nr:glutathione peroxidase [Devosia sp. YR412]SEP60033.1 glutathione peroxidase [Devosia sp. YR412]